MKIYKTTTKLFIMQTRMAVEPENQEVGLDKGGEAGEVS